MITKSKKDKKNLFVVILAIILIVSSVIISQAANIGSLSELLSAPNVGRTIKIGWKRGGVATLAGSSIVKGKWVNIVFIYLVTFIFVVGLFLIIHLLDKNKDTQTVLKEIK